jgi:hypothetical protein
MRGRLIPFQGKVLVRVLEKVEAPEREVTAYGFDPRHLEFAPPRSVMPVESVVEDVGAVGQVKLPSTFFVIGEVIQTPAPHKTEDLSDVEDAFDDGPKREFKDIFKAIFSSGAFGGAIDRMRPPDVHVGDVVLFRCPAHFFDKSLDILGYEDVALVDPSLFIGRIEKEDSDGEAL